jgi:hypothetical protein
MIAQHIKLQSLVTVVLQVVSSLMRVVIMCDLVRSFATCEAVGQRGSTKLLDRIFTPVSTSH